MSKQHHLAGTAFIENQAAGVSPAFEPTVNSGRVLALGTDNDLPIPIHHTLGAELSSDPDFDTAGDWSIFTTNFEIASGELTSDGTIGTGVVRQGATSFSSDSVFAITVEVTGYTQGEISVKPYSGEVSATIPNEIGTHTITLALNTITDGRLKIESFTSYIGSLTLLSIKEITSMANSFLTYHEIANDEIIQIGNAVDGGSSKELTDGLTFTPNGGNTITDNGDGTFTLDVIDNVNGATSSYITYVNGASYLLVFNFIENTSSTGSANFENLSPSNKALNNNYSTHTATTTSGRLWFTALEIGSRLTFSISVKEILPTSTEYILNDVTVNNILTHQMPFSAGDLNLIQQEPNTLAAFVMGEPTPISSVTLDADDSWYACSEESGAYVVDQRAGYGSETITNMTNSVSGAGNTVVLDKPNREATIHIETATDFNVHPSVNSFGDAWTSDILHLEVTFTVSVGSVFIRRLNAGDASGSSVNVDINIEYGVGTYTYIYNGYARDSTGTAYFSLQMDGLNYPLQDSVSIYSMRKATASEIALYTEANRLTNQQKGLQTTALLLDGAGVPSASVATDTARVYSDTVINTGFKPNLDVFSIVETVSGLLEDLNASGVGLGTFTQRTEERVLTHDVAGTDKYYINKTLLGYIPTLPSSTTAIDLNDTAVIGYADTITERHGNFKVYSTVLTQAEIDAL